MVYVGPTGGGGAVEQTPPPAVWDHAVAFREAGLRRGSLRLAIWFSLYRGGEERGGGCICKRTGWDSLLTQKMWRPTSSSH